MAGGVFRDMCPEPRFPGPGIRGVFTLGSIDFVRNVCAIIGRSVVFWAICGFNTVGI